MERKKKLVRKIDLHPSSWSQGFKSFSKVREMLIMYDSDVGRASSDFYHCALSGWVVVRTGPAIWKLSLGILERQVLIVVLLR